MLIKLDKENIQECLDVYDYKEIETAIHNGDLNVNKKLYLHFTQNLNILKLLIKKGIDLNKKDGNGNTALFGANTEKTKLLIKSGIDINSINKNHENALWFGAINPVKELIKNGINVNQKNRQNRTFLWESDEYTSEWILNKGVDIQAKDIKGENALFSLNPFDITKAKLLVLNGIDINVRNQDGNNVLFRESPNFGSSSLAFCILENNKEDEDYNMSIDMYLIEEGIDITVLNKKEENALFYGNFTTISMLLQRGINVNQQNKKSQYPLFKHAEDFIGAYVKSIAEYKEYEVDFFEEKKSVTKFIELIEIFECNGFDLFLSNDKGQNLLDYVIELGNRDEVLENVSLPNQLVSYLVNKGLFDDIKTREIKPENSFESQVRVEYENTMLRNMNFGFPEKNQKVNRI